jgi:hypothetical protein
LRAIGDNELLTLIGYRRKSDFRSIADIRFIVSAAQFAFLAVSHPEIQLGDIFNMNPSRDPKTISGAELRKLLENLTGQTFPLQDTNGLLDQVAAAISKGQPIGHSQFNELLLNVGYDRVEAAFFFYLCDPGPVCMKTEGIEAILSVQGLEHGIDTFRKLALLLYGNVKFGFKTLSRDTATLLFFVQKAYLEKSHLDFETRHDPLVPLKQIPGNETYLLGYISAQEIANELKSSPNDPATKARKNHLDHVISLGRSNHHMYLTYDHLDVYVATSMRERHEFVFVSEFIEKISKEPHIKDLKLRIFDPTLAYCSSRIDKGLAEALMLKRAACTIYLAQESDTLGKDSELASTLAQGKPVIAFVPAMSEKFWRYLYGTFRKIRTNESEEATLIHMLNIYQPNAAWNDPDIQNHLSGTRVLEFPALEDKTTKAVAAHYDKRAKVLKEVHPLGLQTNLNTGVANGLLVARSIEDCAHLVRKILLNCMQFTIENDSDENVLLKEVITGCTFRVMASDGLLTNSFWNFYDVV